MENYSIKQVAELTKISVAAIRKYIKRYQTYFSSKKRGRYNAWVFDTDCINLILRIKQNYVQGMSREEINKDLDRFTSKYPVAVTKVHQPEILSYIKKQSEKIGSLQEEVRLLRQELSEIRNSILMGSNKKNESVIKAKAAISVKQVKKTHPKETWGIFKTAWVHLFQPELLRENQG